MNPIEICLWGSAIAFFGGSFFTVARGFVKTDVFEKAKRNAAAAELERLRIDMEQARRRIGLSVKSLTKAIEPKEQTIDEKLAATLVSAQQAIWDSYAIVNPLRLQIWKELTADDGPGKEKKEPSPPSKNPFTKSWTCKWCNRVNAPNMDRCIECSCTPEVADMAKDHQKKTGQPSRPAARKVERKAPAMPSWEKPLEPYVVSVPIGDMVYSVTTNAPLTMVKQFEEILKDAFKSQHSPVMAHTIKEQQKRIDSLEDEILEMDDKLLKAMKSNSRLHERLGHTAINQYGERVPVRWIEEE